MRQHSRRITSALAIASIAAIAATACSSSSGSPAEYPSGPINYVVPYNPGGSSDPAGREFARLLAAELGTSEVVENLPGGDETIGLTSVITAQPDGQTLGLSSHAGIMVQPLVNPSLPFQSLDDYTAVARMLEAPNAIFVGADSPFQTIEDLITAAEERPGEITIGSTGRLTSPMFAAAGLEREAGVDLNLVPFSGGAGEAVLAAMGGQIDAASVTAAGQLGLVESGDIRALTHTGSAEYDRHLPGSVSMSDAGFDVPYSAAYVTVAPPQLDPATHDKLIAAAEAVAASDAWAQWCEDHGFVALPATADELREWIAAETALQDAAIAMVADAGIQ